MTRKFLVVLIPMIVFAFILSLSFGMITTQAMANPVSNANKTLKVDTVDGKTYSPQSHKKIAAIILFRNAVNGHHVFGFSTVEKYRAFQKQYLKPQNAAGTNYFYENASFDSRGLGSYITLSVGSSYYYVGNSWNDRISSTHIYPSSYVTFYQDWHYQGYYLTLANNGGDYWFQNLTDYNMPNGTNWNDQVSSITSGR
ncbi:hypothetical protein MK805_06590 [Shimazuella sp. AN120528]|uniref:hypothetical protein n=1 Tax=Shimazuella soli TaxID=1892854 RepID=UPI001F0F92C6|nr:hypothetical protein [Shimazuella soli]MCH5584636.1 hypothetical protein [Shimazuella soli]